MAYLDATTEAQRVGAPIGHPDPALDGPRAVHLPWDSIPPLEKGASLANTSFMVCSQDLAAQGGECAFSRK